MVADELYHVPRDGRSAEGGSQECKRGLGLSAVFVARQRFAVLDKNHQILIKNFQNEVTKKCQPPHPSTDYLYPAGTRSGWNVPPALPEAGAPPAPLDHLKARAAPAHPRAPPGAAGGSRWPPLPAASGAQDQLVCSLSTGRHGLDAAQVGGADHAL